MHEFTKDSLRFLSDEPFEMDRQDYLRTSFLKCHSDKGSGDLIWDDESIYALQKDIAKTLLECKHNRNSIQKLISFLQPQNFSKIRTCNLITQIARYTECIPYILQDTLNDRYLRLPDILDQLSPQSVSQLAEFGRIDLVLDAIQRRPEISTNPTIQNALISRPSDDYLFGCFFNIIQVDSSFSKKIPQNLIIEAINTGNEIAAYISIIQGNENQKSRMLLQNWINRERNPSILQMLKRCITY